MAYYGTTAGSTLANPPVPVMAHLGGKNINTTGHGQGQQIWLYNSSNVTSDMSVSGFFSDAYYIGMRGGDIILGACATGSSVHCYVGVIGTVTTDGGAIVSTNGFMSSTR